MNELRTDLDYLTELAEAGAQAPLLGGRYLAWFGLVVSLAYAVHFAILNGALGGPGAAFGALWLAASLIGGLGYVVLLRTQPAKPGFGSAGNRAMSTVWMIAGFSIFAIFVGITLNLSIGAGGLNPDMYVPMVFALYATALVTTGSLGGDRVLVLAGYGALVCVALTAALYGRAELYLAAALAVAATVFVPGLVLMRREPAMVV